MLSEKWLLCLALAFLLGPVSGGNVLVVPADTSHWLIMVPILDELISRGHQVTVLVPSFHHMIDSSQPSSFHLEVITVPISKEENKALVEDILQMWIYGRAELSFWELYSKLLDQASKFMSHFKMFCDMIVSNDKLLQKLQFTGFNVLLADPVYPCGELVAEKLSLPFVYSFRFSEGNTRERVCGFLPAPSSYVPAAMGELTDRMSITERIRNLLLYIFFDFFSHYFLAADLDKFYSEVLGRPTTQCEVMGKAEVWLIRTYWDFEFPRPFLPNFEFVGGLHCQPPKPLPAEMEEFVQSSGEHGIVVFSLGSMVQNLTDEKSNMVALALSQIPQKVIWSYKGKQPEFLGPNTRLYNWIPQNDLLGHSKTKAFITHGGTNGIYEAIYHAVPMVGIPMFADQPDNIIRMKAKGVAVELNIHTMTAKDLVDSLNTVIHNPVYKENAIRLSRIHHDQPVKPLDRAVFWIEFVMRHKGAKHLRPAAHYLNWYQFNSLDVIAFLTACLAVFMFIVVKCCLFCWHKSGQIVRKTKIA